MCIHIIFQVNGIDIQKLRLILEIFVAQMCFRFVFFIFYYFLLYCNCYRQNLDIESNIEKDQKNEKTKRNTDETQAPNAVD